MYLGEENEKCEFKESLGHLKEGLRSLTAMLNRSGQGTVYFGVRDDGTVLGLTVEKKTLVNIRIRINDLIEPQILPVIEDLKDENGKHFIRISAVGYNRPYACDGRYYIRTAAFDEKVSTGLLRKMLVSGTTDLISEMDSEEQNLTFKGLIAFLTQTGLHARDDRSFYRSAGLYNQSGRFNEMAYLLSDQNQMSLKVVRFSGTDKTVMSARNEYGGQCLFYSLNQAFEFVTSFIEVKVRLSDGIRKEIPLFDKESFREAWINACVHNAWSEKLAPAVYMYDDRIEVISYGSIPYDLSLNGFYAGTSVPVNKGLFALFSNAHLTEQTGHGIPTIVAHYGKDAFSFQDNIVKVTLKYAFEPDNVIKRKSREQLITGLTANQQNVYYYLQDHPEATLKQVADNSSLSLSGVKKITDKLRAENLIDRTGSRRSGRWITK